MPEPMSYPPGAPCWADLHTPDQAASERFYTAVLGWGHLHAGPAYDHYGYATWQRHMVAGIAPFEPGTHGDGEETASWIVSFATDSADELADRVAAAGGEVTHGPEDFGVLGRAVVAVDPAGAHVGFWQPRAHLGTGLYREPSALCWAELAVHDTGAADRFYEAVLGLRTTEYTAAGEEHYAAFRLPALGADEPLGEAVAGRTVLGAEQSEAEPFWMPYFGTRDAKETASVARREGATVLYEGVNGEGRGVAVLRDPQGAVLALLELPA
ncbi:VOC family protein [Streptomyces sp. A73]|uniref:VOC family protein n=1 Tax=Streptomyces smyrnaeus TaxID=1387713 RepID=UPI001B61262A|nr:VOC family protein [Streptomyces sp. A73]